MAIDDPSVVDIVGIQEDKGLVVLAIADHLPWDALPEHLLLLQEKVNAYVAFVESGQLHEKYPRAAHLSVSIDLVMKHPPSAEAEVWLERFRAVLGDAGHVFTRRVLTGE